MADPRTRYAILSAELVRVPGRHTLSEELVVHDADAGDWQSDLRLFGITWLAGFVFFLAYLS